MTPSTATLNQLEAKVIIQALVDYGIEHISISPGSRSTPLTLAAASEPRLQKHVHFDERGLGYFSLGIAKATQKPTALIVTSGTAVANLLPSVIEAYYAYVPLVILSADRPPELLDCGANQSIDQKHLLGKYAKFEHLPCPESLEMITPIPERILRGILAHGPVHFNCAFREPLYEH